MPALTALSACAAAQIPPTQLQFSYQVPELWLKRSFPSLKPLGSYIKEVIERCEFFRSWLEEGAPTVYWLSGFFFTQVGAAELA